MRTRSFGHGRKRRRLPPGVMRELTEKAAYLLWSGKDAFQQIIFYTFTTQSNHRKTHTYTEYISIIQIPKQINRFKDAIHTIRILSSVSFFFLWF